MPEGLPPRLGPGGYSYALDGQRNKPALSLVHLKVGENFQRINHSAKELVRRTENFPGFEGQPACYRGVPMGVLSEMNNLRAMIGLAENITGRLEVITSLALEDLPEPWRNEGSSHARDEASEEPATPPREKKENGLSSACRICARQDTPRWRWGPDGPGTLCNVCGLVFAKRRRRKQTARARGISVST